MLPDVGIDQLQRAVGVFDQQYRDSADWRGWVGQRNHKHAIAHSGDYYPPKMIVSLATGVPRDSFSGGDEANNYLATRGFRVISLDSLPLLLALWMQRYPNFSPGEGYGGGHPLWSLMKRMEAVLSELPAVAAREHLVVEASAGKGRLAHDPWIAIYDRRETTSVQSGLYVVFLFRRDMSGVYLTLNQGVTDVYRRHEAAKASKHPDADAADELARSSTALRGQCGRLAAAGFALDSKIALASSGLGKKYEASTIAHRFYGIEQMPTDSQLAADLTAVLTTYDDMLAAKHGWSAKLQAPEPQLGLEAVHRSFADNLIAAGIKFGPPDGSRHDDFVRAFLASLATKRFVILTGLSGSGKTQIALKFGEWLGSDRHAIVPVRPDWTGPEAVLGFENALAPRGAGGSAVWHAPQPLAFMLRARGTQEPSLLVLDEMNLAHVERYFADLLSGMESGAGCLPNLIEAQGRWVRNGGPESVALPSNLFVVGTVNVDETTYMFSPKVLDRANTIEFRVHSSDLGDAARQRPPTQCTPGPARAVRAFVDVACNPSWHVDHAPEFLGTFGDHLRALHDVLAPFGFEFGHRVYQEAARFAAIHSAMGGRGLEEALDLQLLQKILPRVHGTRRRLEPVLRQLGSYAFYAASRSDKAEFDPETASGQAALPLAFDKIRRMTAKVRTDQFASFAE